MDVYLMDGWAGITYALLAIISFTAYHFMPSNVTEIERLGAYEMFGRVGPGPVLVGFMRFFGTDHLFLALAVVLVSQGIIPPFKWITYGLLFSEALVMSTAVVVSYVIWCRRRIMQKELQEFESDGNN